MPSRSERACSASPTAGQQLILCNWLLRFFQPGPDDERLRVIVAGLDGFKDEDGRTDLDALLLYVLKCWLKECHARVATWTRLVSQGYTTMTLDNSLECR